MQNKIIEDAIANMASTSAALEKFCDDPKNHNSYGTHLLKQMSWELHKRVDELKEFDYMYGF